mmetsp:Transcript_26328/g.44431  ORF Transcript_26328/g.44431 Transcript_26328/m.44431 type:complete len:296 (+) Transcript_26328:216-1103(+)
MGTGTTGDSYEGGTPNVNTRLMKACRKGNYDLCRILLRRGGDVTYTGASGNTCLHVAVQEGHLDVVHMLCSDYSAWRHNRRGSSSGDERVEVDPQYYDSDDDRSDCELSGSGRFECLNDRQQDALTARNDKGETALFVACRCGYEDLARYLSQRMTTRSVNCLDNFGQSPLWIAAHQGSAEIVRALYTVGGDLEQSNRHGQSPLWAAASQGHLRTVRALCDLQCELDERSNDHTTPLGAALEADHMAVVDLLTTYGATAWHNASLLSSSPSSEKLLAHTMPCPPMWSGDNKMRRK